MEKPHEFNANEQKIAVKEFLGAHAEDEAIAEKIKCAVTKYGTLILNFTHNKKKRNILVGSNIAKAFEKRGYKLKGKGVVWGQTEGTRSCIKQKDGKYYIRGFENHLPEGATDNGHLFKEFTIEKIEGEISGIRVG